MAVLKVFNMTIEYINFINSKALQNLPKLGFLVLKTYHLATLIRSRKTQ
jgi:hypothetical protein